MREFALTGLLCAAAALGAGRAPRAANLHAPTASYIPYELFELVLEADIVVIGEIVSLDAQDFGLKVERKLVGEGVGPLLRVRRFEDWLCAWRWEPYAIGQRVILFLEKPRDATPRILSGGGEGEMPILADVVTLRTGPLPGRRLERGEEAPGAREVPLDTLESAILALRREVACVFETDEFGRHLTALRPRNSLANLETLAASSQVAHALSVQVRSQGTWQGARSSPGRRIAVAGLRTLELTQAGGAPRAGASVVGPTPVGDVDGDGHPDVACVAQGTLQVSLLDREGAVRGESGLRGQGAPIPAELQESLKRATALASLGDLDGDGGVDLVLGATPRSTLEPDRGSLWILGLDRTGALVKSTEVRTLAVRGPERIERAGLGRALASLGDRDGDGTVELAVSAHPTDEPDSPFARAVFVASLDRRGAVAGTRCIPRRRSFTSDDDGSFGRALASLGDVDGDGFADLAVGTPETGSGIGYGAHPGAVWISFLDASGEPVAQQQITLGRGEFVGDLADLDDFGRAVCGPGDLDGNGVPDLLVGSSSGVWTLFLAPDGTVVRHEKLEDGPRDGEDAVHFGDRLALLPRRAPDAPLTILCSGTRGRGAAAVPVVWRLALGADGVLSPR